MQNLKRSENETDCISVGFQRLLLLFAKAAIGSDWPIGEGKKLKASLRKRELKATSFYSSFV